jgi:hypothetical protein
MKEKLEIMVGLILVIAVSISLLIYALNIGILNNVKFGLFIIAILLVTTVLYILWDRAKNVQKGLPAKDERLINITYKAGYYGFIAAVLSSVFGPLLSDVILNRELEGYHVTTIIVLVSGFIFIVSYLFLARKGN